jgi:parvulin-like peptidyl-prolyl isomerase
VKEEKRKELKEASGEIIRAIRSERGKGEAAKAADADRGRALAGTDFSLLAQERGIPRKESSLSGPDQVVADVGPVEEFNRAAFSMAPNEVSSAIEGPSAYYLLRVKQRKEPAVPPLEGVRSDLEKRMKEMKALELANRRAGELLAQLKKEKDVQKLAKEHGLKVEETGWFLRRDSEIPKVGAVQEAAPGSLAISVYQPIADRVYSRRDGVYLFAFKDSQGADMERFEREKRYLMEKALGEKKERILKEFVEQLRAKAQIQIRSKFLEEG